MAKVKTSDIVEANKQKKTKAKPTKIQCNHMDCQRMLSLNSSNFYRSKNKKYESFGGYYPICRECLKKELLNQDGTLNMGKFRDILKDMDYPYISDIYYEVYEKWKREYEGRSSQEKILGMYIMKLSMNGYRNATWLDGEGKALQSRLEQTIFSDEKEDDFIITPKIREFWGELQDIRSYAKYQKAFEDLCEEDGGYIDSVKENYFKNIVILQNLAQEQLSNGNTTEYTKTIKALQEVCTQCAINPKNKIEREEANRGTYGVFIKMIEEDHPILDPERDLDKIDVVRRCLEVFFLGHLCEVLGLRNPLKCKYDEVMQEYSVKVDTYEDLMNIEENEDGRVKVVRGPKLSKLRSMFSKKSGGEKHGE